PSAAEYFFMHSDTPPHPTVSSQVREWTVFQPNERPICQSQALPPGMRCLHWRYRRTCWRTFPSRDALIVDAAPPLELLELSVPAQYIARAHLSRRSRASLRPALPDHKQRSREKA